MQNNFKKWPISCENTNTGCQGYSPDVAFRWFLSETGPPLPGAQKVRKDLCSFSNISIFGIEKRPPLYVVLPKKCFNWEAKYITSQGVDIYNVLEYFPCFPNKREVCGEKWLLCIPSHHRGLFNNFKLWPKLPRTLPPLMEDDIICKSKWFWTEWSLSFHGIRDKIFLIEENTYDQIWASVWCVILAIFSSHWTLPVHFGSQYNSNKVPRTNRSRNKIATKCDFVFRLAAFPS